MAPAGPVVSQPPAAEPSPAPYDISRVDAIKDDFPAGFTAQAHPAKTLGEQDIAGSAVAAFTDAQVDPPQCRSVVIPPYVDPKAGTEAAGVIGQGDQGNMYVVALRSPNPIAAGDDPAGCDRISLSGSPEATGTVERIPAPAIAGATTTGVKLSVEDPQEDPDYLYSGTRRPDIDRRDGQRRRSVGSAAADVGPTGQGRHRGPRAAATVIGRTGQCAPPVSPGLR